MTAKKTNISDIVNGEWVKKEGMEPSFVVSPNGDEISRARILGTIVAKFIAEDGNFAAMTMDDTTETIRGKVFKTVKPIDSFEIGDLVDLIGKTREYNGELYIIPEIIRKVEDPNLELLRKLEIMKKPKVERKETKATETKTEKKVTKNDKGDLRKDILKFIESQTDGVEYGKVLENIKGKESEIESIVNEILAEGICYEPTPGKIKKI